MKAAGKIDLNNLDKSNWKSYRFDEIAKNISERVDPNNTDLEVYVGLEHIDSESLHIKRTGTPDDVDGQKLKFYKGDIIFGRRRAYQRKAGIATTDGFCSAHALVLRANSDVIDPRLFPFFLHSDLFMNRAVDISVGSLSPTINWGTLKHQELILPPKEFHAELAELLWSIDESVQADNQVKNKVEILRSSYLKNIYMDFPSNFPNAEIVEIGTLIKLSSGKTRPNELTDFESGKYKFPVYGGNGIIGYSKEYLIDYPTIILGRVGEYCGAVHNSISKAWISDNALYVTEFKAAIDTLYLSRYLEFIDLNKQQNRSSYPLITQGKVNTNKICILPDDVIANAMKRLLELEKSIDEVMVKIQNSKLLYKCLLNGAF